MEKKFKSFKKKILPRVINEADERVESIKNNTPARFEIKRNLKNKNVTIADRIYNLDSLGQKAVQKYNEIINKKAKKHNLDPDIIRSVMFAENARGHLFGINKKLDDVKLSKSALPMNIQKDNWSSFCIFIGKANLDSFTYEYTKR